MKYTLGFIGIGLAVWKFGDIVYWLLMHVAI